jgi:hypothetical protein
VLGSKRNLSLVDLLSMKTLWTVMGKFTSFTVAKNEQEALSFDVLNLLIMFQMYSWIFNFIDAG